MTELEQQLLATHVNQLSAKDRNAFMTAFRQSNDSRKAMIMSSLSRMHPDIVTEYGDQPQQSSFGWGGKKRYYNNGGEFRAEDMYVPTINGEPVTHSGLVPVDQRVLIVDTPAPAPRRVTPRNNPQEEQLQVNRSPQGSPQSSRQNARQPAQVHPGSLPPLREDDPRDAEFAEREREKGRLEGQAIMSDGTFRRPPKPEGMSQERYEELMVELEANHRVANRMRAEQQQARGDEQARSLRGRQELVVAGPSGTRVRGGRVGERQPTMESTATYDVPVSYGDLDRINPLNYGQIPEHISKRFRVIGGSAPTEEIYDPTTGKFLMRNTITGRYTERGIVPQHLKDRVGNTSRELPQADSSRLPQADGSRLFQDLREDRRIFADNTRVQQITRQESDLRNPQLNEVPDIVGLSYKDAYDLLIQRGLRPNFDPNPMRMVRSQSVLPNNPNLGQIITVE